MVPRERSARNNAGPTIGFASSRNRRELQNTAREAHTAGHRFPATAELVKDELLARRLAEKKHKKKRNKDKYRRKIRKQELEWNEMGVLALCQDLEEF